MMSSTSTQRIGAVLNAVRNWTVGLAGDEIDYISYETINSFPGPTLCLTSFRPETRDWTSS